jgi:hypothetical protein
MGRQRVNGVLLFLFRHFDFNFLPLGILSQFCPCFSTPKTPIFTGNYPDTDGIIFAVKKGSQKMIQA